MTAQEAITGTIIDAADRGGMPGGSAELGQGLHSTAMELRFGLFPQLLEGVIRKSLVH